LRLKKRTYLSLLLVAIIGLGLSLTTFFYVKQWEFAVALNEKKRQTDENMRVLRQTFITFGNILSAIRGLTNVHYPITQQKFAQFVKSDMLNQPGIQALEWIAVVSSSQRQAITTIRSNDFRFWEFSPNGDRRIAKEREIYYPVLKTEPMSSNSDALGYDVGSDPILKNALEKARDIGQLTTSGAIFVRTAQGNELGFRVFLPVYRGNLIPPTVAARRHQLLGFAEGVFLFNTLVEQVLRVPKQRTEVFTLIKDDTQGAQRPILYAPTWYNFKKHNKNRELWSTPFEFGGRLWRIVSSKATNKEIFQIWYAWIVLAVGVIFTAGLLRYMYVILINTYVAEELVTKRTQSLSNANQALNQEINTREEITRELEKSQQRFQAIFNEAAIGIAQTSLDDKILDSNRALQTLLRYREGELNQKLLKNLAYPDDANIDQLLLEKILAGKYETYRVSKRYICKNGSIVWTNQSCSIVRDTNSPFLINMIEDITERKQAEEARLHAEKKYRDIFENAIEGIFQCTPNGQFLSVNPAFVRMFGYDSPEEIYTQITDIEQQLYVDQKRRGEFITLLKTHSHVQNFEYQARRRDGTVIWVNETVRVVRDNKGKINYYEGIVENVTKRKQTEEKLRYDATHDQLTGLLNRTAFTIRLREAIDKKKVFAVLFIDLDEFKIINDFMGHFAGDQLLTEIARRLKHHASENDVVARFGGDEFALLLRNPPDLALLKQHVEGFQQQLNQPYTLKNETFNPTASIGIALNELGSLKYDSADKVLRDADTAMYEAKQQGRGNSLIFDPEMRVNMIKKLRMESDLRKALDREEFRLYYQPIISLETRKTVSLEALVRWEHPIEGMVRPDLFIPLTEETGLIKELGLWVFETACYQLHHWQTQFSHHANLGMNINVSPIQIKQAQLVNQIKEIIKKTGIKAPTCHVEITETAMMKNPEAAMMVFNELKSLDVLLYIDDFGTGYSSLSYLQKFPIDAVKIDKSFIQQIDTSSQSTQVVHAIIALADAFDLRVVAEGVETSLQISMLKAAHCQHVQGYFFSPPKAPQIIEEYLKIETHKLT
jgi:diguanylate cyclase (GGDEF)-like protein/PAS domain S-box-containing protein